MDRTTEREFNTIFGSFKDQQTIHDTINTTRIGLERDADKYIDAVATMKAYCIICRNSGAHRPGACKTCPRRMNLDKAMQEFQGLDQVRIDAETWKKTMAYAGPLSTGHRWSDRKSAVFLILFSILGIIAVCVPFVLIEMFL